MTAPTDSIKRTTLVLVLKNCIIMNKLSNAGHIIPHKIT